MKTVFKENDKVFDVRYGWGKVDLIYNPNHYPIVVKYKIGHISYTLDGKSSHEDLTPMLSFTEYTLQGFSQERAELLPERGQIVWVRDSELDEWVITQFISKEGDRYKTTDSNPFGDKHKLCWNKLTTINPYTK